MERVGRPLVIGPLVVLLALALGGAYLRSQEGRIGLGDRGRVTAINDGGCASIHIELGDLRFEGGGWDEETGDSAVPRSWRGRSIEGRLVLDHQPGEDRAEGTFIADDGTEIEVSGGRDQFFTLGCAIWSD